MATLITHVHDKSAKLHCVFFINKKNRYCRLIPCKASQFCAEHLNSTDNENGIELPRKRIPCPNDPRHTCYEDKLRKHLKKCNSRETPQPDYYKKNINSGSETLTSEKLRLSVVSKEVIIEAVEKFRAIYHRYPLEIDDALLFHNALKEKSETPGFGYSALKHIKQQASILGQLDSLGLLKDQTVFVEFGAGKGHLAHWTFKAMPECKNNSFVTVDRGSIKHKLDWPHIHDKQDFQRLKIDIKDLNLGEVTCIRDTKRPVVAMSKHLCGVATDLTARCLINTVAATQLSHSCQNKEYESSPKSQKLESTGSWVKAAIIALCCHHRCDWSHYCGQEFFISENLCSQDFALLQSLSGWATCGFKNKEDVNDTSDEEDEKLSVGDKDTENGEHNHSIWTNEEKKDLGRMCKRLIDIGRIKYLENHGFKVTLKRYIDSSVSLENIMLVAVRNG